MYTQQDIMRMRCCFSCMRKNVYTCYLGSSVCTMFKGKYKFIVMELHV